MSSIVRSFEWLSRRSAAVAIVVHAGIAAALVSMLPANAWFVGDPGTKLVAARDAIAHPGRPLESDLPPVARGETEDYRQPFFVPHGDHAHAFTSPLFPLATAPFLHLFGLHGLYVLPAIGWVLIAPLTVALARRLQSRGSPTAIWIATATMTPFVFYGLEFWEHAPAVAALLGSACLALGKPAAGSAIRLPSPMSLIVSGLLGAVAIALRPESIWGVFAILIVIGIRSGAEKPEKGFRESFSKNLEKDSRNRFLTAARAVALIAAGVAIGMVPQALYHWRHFGTLTPEHVSGNLAELSTNWWEERVDFANIWLGIHRGWTRVAAGLVAFGAIVGRFADNRRWVLTVAMLGVAGLAFEIARGHELRENLWRALPLAILAMLPGGPATPARRMLWVLIAVPFVGVLLTAPNDGGGQWGPRYLLGSVPALVVLAFDTAKSLPAALGRRLAWALVTLVLASAMFVSFSAFAGLRDTKRFYAQLVGDTARAAADRDVLTDVWWVPQVNAAVLDPKRVLWVSTPSKGARWLASRPGRDVLLVRIADPSLSLDDWIRGTCYKAVSERQSDGGLLYVTLSCGSR